ncbi:MAG: hypothetical protein KTR30_23895 [Saprospiraceae bacterium]|nr:hypothetical protein [Saprospiraceae bacterium]
MKTIFTRSDCLSLHQLQSYQAGALSKTAKRKVEEHLIDCPLCNGALEGMEQSSNPGKDVQQIRSLQLQKRKTFHPYRIVAAIALGLILLAALWFRPQANPASLFATFYQAPQPTRIQLRGTPETAAQQAIQPALIAYQKKDFKSATNLLGLYLEDFPQDNQAYLWMGIAQLEIGHDQKAIQFFQELRSRDEDHYQKASWYLILTYLKIGEQARAREVVNELEVSGGQEFEEELMRLQDKLKRLPAD